MILLTAVVIGLLAGFVRAKRSKRSFQPVRLKLEWLVIVAILPQLLVFFIPSTSAHVSDTWASIILVSSLSLLLAFCLVNIQQSGFWLLGIGLALNLLVVILNGGWMPIRPEILMQNIPDTAQNAWQIGQRLGITKDMVLPLEQTRLWWLSDYFVTPGLFTTRYAFSIGDIILSLGIIAFIWSLAGPMKENS